MLCCFDFNNSANVAKKYNFVELPVKNNPIVKI